MARRLFRRPTARRRLLGRVLQFVIAAILVVGLLTRNVAVVVNAVLGLGVTVLPSVLRRDYGVPLDPRLGLLVTLAISLHTVGMVGPYETTWWWNHLTHALSASVVAIVGYTVIRAFDEHSDVVHFSPRFLAFFVFLFVVALGVVWEVLEFAARGVGLPPRRQPGTRPVRPRRHDARPRVRHGGRARRLAVRHSMVARDGRELRGVVRPPTRDRPARASRGRAVKSEGRGSVESRIR